MPFLLADSILNGRQVPLYEGDFKRDWTFVDDIVSGVVSATDRPLGFEIINLGRGAPESLSHFIKIMESVAGEKANLVGQPAPSTEMLTTFADTTKAKRLLDFDPQVALAEGVERFWNWFVSRQFEMGKNLVQERCRTTSCNLASRCCSRRDNALVAYETRQLVARVQTIQVN